MKHFEFKGGKGVGFFWVFTEHVFTQVNVGWLEMQKDTTANSILPVQAVSAAFDNCVALEEFDLSRTNTPYILGSHLIMLLLWLSLS